MGVIGEGFTQFVYVYFVSACVCVRVFVPVFIHACEPQHMFC